MGKIEYSFMCAICGKKRNVEFDISDEDLVKVDAGMMDLKDVLKPGSFQREVLISGMCYDCQEKTFNRPAPGHEEEWGEPVKECPICGCPLYKKNVDEDRCPTCHCKISVEMHAEYDEEEECEDAE